ncbi:MAG: rRNA maturation RNase YbeY [Planctomycetaceae bacterium]
MYEIEINNAQTSLPIDSHDICEFLKQVLKIQEVTAASLSVALVDNEEIHRVNREHLGHDYPTDVVSFLYDEEIREPVNEDAPRGQGKSLDGELVVSAEMAVQRAAEFHWSPEEELKLYLAHGLLHLCGYDDLTPEEEPQMRAAEQVVLQSLGLLPHYIIRPSDDS